ncbi:MAG TPA: SDR family oxidoreductase [Thermoleophilaceae bacterium]|jgi:long-chain acyl-CoA synthetase
MPGFDSRGAVLLTGATGFVGMELLARFLERGSRRVYALVRASDDEEAAARLRPGMASVFGDPDAHPGRVLAVAGDIERPGLGLDRQHVDRIADEVTTVVHCAASVSFGLTLEEARSVNVDGTRRMVELAERCAVRGDGLERFSYVSTAYVAGTHRGTFREDQLDVGQGFRNPYERTKFEAERLVRSRDGLPAQILRPSIVVGERDSGWTSSFNVLYAPLRAFSRGAFPAVPARRRSPVDIVPVDYVADAGYELIEHGPDETFHLVAGRDATNVARLMELACGHFDRPPPRVFPPGLYRRVVHPLLLRRLSGVPREALRRSEVYFPYFSMRVRYDDSRARERLEPAGVRMTPVEDYFDRLLDFAHAARWGRRRLGRIEARRLAAA